MSTERPDKDAVSDQKRRSPLIAASVAAAVLLAGGGGAYWASTAGDGAGGTKNTAAPGGDGDPPPLALDGHTEGDAPADTPSDAPGIAPGEPDPSGVTYRAKGELPDGPGSAFVYRSSGAVGEADVTRLAGALGVKGTPRVESGAWQVGISKDGSGPVLRVNKEAPGTWTFAQYGPGRGDNCAKGEKCGGTSVAPGGQGKPVSEKAAKDAAAPVLKALGQDDAALDARQLMGAVRVVNADPEVGGLPTYGWATGLQIGADGKLVGGSGQLKELKKGAEYPVIGADEALKELNRAGNGRVGIGGCATPVPHGDKPDGELKPVAPCEPDGRKAPASPEPVTVDGASFGLAALYVDGRQALVPSWLFEVDPAGEAEPFTITHPAVDPKYLTKPPATPPESVAPAPPKGKDHAREQHIESYTVDGRKLKVHFWGGVCSDYAAKASEVDGMVKVRVVEPKPDPKRACIMIAKELTETVTLDKPLADRKVVDEQGKTVPRA